MERKNGDFDKKIPDVSSLMATTVFIILNTKIGENEYKIADSGG